MNAAALVVELQTEELPPKSLQMLSQSFASSLLRVLSAHGLASKDAATTVIATPRRIGVKIDAVLSKGAASERDERLIPASVGLNAEGQPLPPLTKKLASLGLSDVQVDALERRHDGKQDILYVRREVAGSEIGDVLQKALDTALNELPIAKVMTYQIRPGTTEEAAVRFVRPVHHLVALHGQEVVNIQTLGLSAGRTTVGHRFLSNGPITLTGADSYLDALEKAHVMGVFSERRKRIADALKARAGSDTVVMPQALLDEVTGLVEWPVVMEGHFDEAFLEVPAECLVLTMQQNQKYFAITRPDGAMTHRFLIVANVEEVEGSAVVAGNERVIRARLSDARFFFDQDRRTPLGARVKGLEHVVYHQKLGTQGERVRRLVQIAQGLAPLVGADDAQAARAALLCKADLVTDMVGEFPELQGLMGGYYARHDGEPEAVCQAIADHYRPRFSGDALPSGPVGVAVSLADKLESLTGLFGTGYQPSGEKDPYALRRSAVGVLRLLRENNVQAPLGSLLDISEAAFDQGVIASGSRPVLEQFLADRLRAMLKDEGRGVQEIEAVLAVQSGGLPDIVRRLQAVETFATLSEAPALASANKRIRNLLKKAETTDVTVNAALLKEPGEKALAQALGSLRSAQAAYEEGDYTGYLRQVAALKGPVDAFFDGVMVMADDPALRANRLALLSELDRVMNRVADLSMLAAAQ